MKLKYQKLIILGAGLSGLSVAYHYPGKSAIFEKGGKIGGTSSTEQYEFFYFDHGLLVSFTNDKYIQDLLATHTLYVEEVARPMNSSRRKEFPYPGLLSLNKLPKVGRYNIMFLRNNVAIPVGRYSTYTYVWSCQVINQGKEIANDLANSIGISSKVVV
ncbi:MAG: FAD/NAD(P)-binding protein [Conexivisphaerales archaeon]